MTTAYSKRTWVLLGAATALIATGAAVVLNGGAPDAVGFVLGGLGFALFAATAAIANKRAGYVNYGPIEPYSDPTHLDIANPAHPGNPIGFYQPGSPHYLHRNE